MFDFWIISCLYGLLKLKKKNHCRFSKSNKMGPSVTDRLLLPVRSVKSIEPEAVVEHSLLSQCSPWKTLEQKPYKLNMIFSCIWYWLTIPNIWYGTHIQRIWQEGKTLTMLGITVHFIQEIRLSPAILVPGWKTTCRLQVNQWWNC